MCSVVAGLCGNSNPSGRDMFASINTFPWHLGCLFSAIGMSVDTLSSSTQAASHDSSSATEILRLKRKLVVMHQELDEACGSRLKNIP